MIHVEFFEGTAYPQVASAEQIEQRLAQIQEAAEKRYNVDEADEDLYGADD